MNWADQKAVFAIIRRIMPVVLSTIPADASTLAASALRRMVGMVEADQNMLHINTFAGAFGMCVDVARVAGATLTSMGRVRKAALAEAPVSPSEVLVVQTIVRLTLAQEARIIAAMSFKSRNEVDAISVEINAAFYEAEEAASDDLEAATYIEIVGLHASVTKHLADRGRILPRVVTASFASTMPALAIAQQLYGSGSRVQEIVAENDIVHPAFCPTSLKVLAV